MLHVESMRCHTCWLWLICGFWDCCRPQSAKMYTVKLLTCYLNPVCQIWTGERVTCADELEDTEDAIGTCCTDETL